MNAAVEASQEGTCLKCKTRLETDVEFCPVCGNKRTERLDAPRIWSRWDTIGTVIVFAMVIVNVFCCIFLPNAGITVAYICGCVVVFVGYCRAIGATLNDEGFGKAVASVLIPPVLVLDIIMEHRRYSWALSLIAVGCLLCALPLYASGGNWYLKARPIYLVEDQENDTLLFFSDDPGSNAVAGALVRQVRLTPPTGQKTLNDVHRWVQSRGDGTTCLGQSRKDDSVFQVFPDVYACQDSGFRVLGNRFKVYLSIGQYRRDMADHEPEEESETEEVTALNEELSRS